MYTILKCGVLVTGDGKTLFKNKAIWIKEGRFIDITNFDDIPTEGDMEIISAEMDLVAPGAINYHTHGCTMGPIFPSGATALSKDKVISNLKRHLSQGTTTLCNVCGFALPEETEYLKKEVPVNIYLSSAHTPLNIRAAQIVDGQGLNQRHITMTVGEMIEAGAVAVGEIGGGHTLGGGGQDYLYIPKAVEKKTGIKISPSQARKLKFAILGRYMDKDSYNNEHVYKLLNDYGLSEKISVAEIGNLIKQCVLPSINTALEGFEEAFESARKFNIPLIVHTSAPSAKKIEELLFKNQGDVEIIAAHCNHDTFEVEEAVLVTERLKSLGAIIDLGTFDITPKSQLNTGGCSDYFDAMAESGLADVISTDYNGGWWDGIYEGISRIVKKGYLDIRKAVALGTGNLRKVVPLLAKNRGLIQKGFAADFIIASKDDIGKIKSVFVNGTFAARGDIDG